MADKKITALPEVTNTVVDDYLTLVRPGDPVGTKNKKISVANSLIKNTNVIYYAKQGDSINHGENVNSPLDNPVNALGKVVSPSPSNPYLIIGLDAAPTSGDMDLPQNVVWMSPYATHTGRVTFNGEDSGVALHEVIGNNSDYCLYANGPYSCFADVDIVKAGDDGRGIRLDSGAACRVNIKFINAFATNAQAWEITGSSFLAGTIITKREDQASTVEALSHLLAYIHDDGGAVTTQTTIYNNLSSIKIHADTANNVDIESTAGNVVLTAPYVNINGSLIDAGGYLNLDNYYFKDKKIVGNTPAVGAFFNHPTGIAASKILPPVEVIVSAVDGRHILRENDFATNSKFGVDIQADGTLGITVLAGATNVAARAFKANIRHEP